MEKNKTRQKAKYIILALCCISYTFSYICRTNLSVALGYMHGEGILSESQTGVIGMLFFWIYASGQILSGYITEKIRPKSIITAGLSASVLLNAFIGMLCIIRTDNFFIFLAVLWSLNAVAQSLLWCPTYKIIIDTFEPHEHRRVSVIISYPTTIGYLLSWGGLGSLISVTGFEYAFIIPSALMCLFLFVWITRIKIRDKNYVSSDINPERIENKIRNETEQEKIIPGNFVKNFTITIIFMGIICFIQGFIKENVSFWTPSLLLKIKPADISSAAVSFISTFIPIAGTIGIAFTAPFAKKLKNSNFLMLLLIYILSGILVLLLLLVYKIFFAVVICTGALMMLLCCCNVILTAYVPLDFVRYGRSAQISGLLNFIVYAGAGAGGLVTGRMSGENGFGRVYLVWLFIIAAAVFTLFLWRLFIRRIKKERTG